MKKTKKKQGFSWPENDRIAVVVSVLLENWSEGKGPPYSIQTTPLKPGTHDRAAMTWGQYGGTAGVWRLLRILNEHKVPATFIASARSIELHPSAVQQILESGYEIAAHSYTQDTLLAYLSPAEEKKVIRRCIRIFEEKIGERPKGWVSPVLAPTEHTANFLAQEGFLWYGDYNDRDLPCRIKTKHGTFVAIPHSDFVDNRVLRQSPRSWYDVYKDTFDYLYQSEPTSYLNLTVHCQFGGRPLIAAMFTKILKYMLGFPGVWFVRHDTLAQWIMDNEIDEWTNEERFFG